MIRKYCTEFRDRVASCILIFLIYNFKHSDAINSNLYHYYCKCDVTLCTPEDAENAINQPTLQRSYNEAGETEKYDTLCHNSTGKCVCGRRYFQFGSKLAGCYCRNGKLSDRNILKYIK